MKIVTGKTGTAHVTSADARALNAGIVGLGNYVLATGAKFAYTKKSDNLVEIADGDIVINGCHARIGYGEKQDVSLRTNDIDKNRIDLIVARYELSSGVESVDLVVKEGTAVSGTPAVPSYAEGDILENDDVVEYPLYKVTFNGVDLTSIEKMFTVQQPINEMFNLIYPVGSIYMSVNNTNPSTLFGGTWEQWGAGRVPVGVLSTDTSFNTAGKTGGTKVTSGTIGNTTLTINQIPSHNHIAAVPYISAVGRANGVGEEVVKEIALAEGSTRNTGGSQAHTHTFTGGADSNLQPYITCYMWKRTA